MSKPNDTPAPDEIAVRVYRDGRSYDMTADDVAKVITAVLRHLIEGARSKGTS